MSCQECKSERVASAMCKCSDLTGFSVGNVDVHSVYVPDDWGIGGGDYIRLSYCMDCGQMQGSFPLEITELEEEADEESDPDFSDEHDHDEDEAQFNED